MFDYMYERVCVWIQTSCLNMYLYQYLVYISCNILCFMHEL